MSRIPAPAENPAELAKWHPPDFPHDPLLLFRVLQVHPELASRMRVLGSGLLAHGRLPDRDREIVIDRITARNGARYEWGVHAAHYGPQVGLSAEQLAGTTEPRPSAETWSEADLALLAAVDELDATASLDDATWARLRDRYSDPQLVELIVLTGWYRTIGYLCNALDLEPEPWATPWPTG
ncbi:carboxymuconolactone decarboxylase family protein [Saccharopolyspora sp. 5N102]|uniref:carboxymuconolactone decarboxylase family protein n=1 Tax=Saccharopolyspora sp. 5N102 TaxID=3375155 RepID=UPI0037A8001D